MRRNFARPMLAVISFALLLASLVPAANAAEQCTAATLTGSSGFTFSGFVKDHGRTVPFAGAGLSTADGAGNVSATITASVNGSIETFPYTATYVVNPDCTGSVTSTSGGANFSIVIVGGGKEVLGVAIDSGSTWTIDIKKI
jgi:hypothetical protein